MNSLETGASGTGSQRPGGSCPSPAPVLITITGCCDVLCACAQGGTAPGALREHFRRVAWAWFLACLETQ